MKLIFQTVLQQKELSQKSLREHNTLKSILLKDTRVRHNKDTNIPYGEKINNFLVVFLFKAPSGLL